MIKHFAEWALAAVFVLGPAFLVVFIVSATSERTVKGDEAYAETVTRVREERREEVEAQSAPVDTLPSGWFAIAPEDTQMFRIRSGTWLIQSEPSDPWAWRTVRFPDNADTMRIIIGTDTLYSAENFWRVLIRYEIERYFRETLKGAENFQETRP